MPATILSPIASAPAATAARTPVASVTPQILTNGRRATLAGSSGAAPAVDEGADRGRWIGRADQRLADECAVEPERAPAGDRRGLADARLGDDQPVVGDVLAQPGCPLDVDVERPQVAVVEPDQAGATGERALQLALVVDLDERLETDLESALDESGEPPRRMEDREQQDEVGAGGTQERQLDFLDHEVLGEDRDGDRRADRPEVVDRAAEPVRFAQDGDRRRAARLHRLGRGRRHPRPRPRSSRPTAMRA